LAQFRWGKGGGGNRQSAGRGRGGQRREVFLKRVLEKRKPEVQIRLAEKKKKKEKHFLGSPGKERAEGMASFFAANSFTNEAGGGNSPEGS